MRQTNNDRVATIIDMSFDYKLNLSENGSPGLSIWRICHRIKFNSIQSYRLRVQKRVVVSCAHDASKWPFCDWYNFVLQFAQKPIAIGITPPIPLALPLDAKPNHWRFLYIREQFKRPFISTISNKNWNTKEILAFVCFINHSQWRVVSVEFIALSVRPNQTKQKTNKTKDLLDRPMYYNTIEWTTDESTNTDINNSNINLQKTRTLQIVMNRMKRRRCDIAFVCDKRANRSHCANVLSMDEIFFSPKQTRTHSQTRSNDFIRKVSA